MQLLQQVILVDENDNAIGFMEKMEAHKQGVLHRAFSVFIFNSKNEMLLQRRGLNKYHSAGLWSNACCSHPYPGEETKDAAERRLYEEMGFHTPLEKLFEFTYAASFDNSLTENEYDHVFIGRYDGEIIPNPDEADSYSFESMPAIKEKLVNHPEEYTAWFKIAFPRIEELMENS